MYGHVVSLSLSLSLLARGCCSCGKIFIRKFLLGQSPPISLLLGPNLWYFPQTLQVVLMPRLQSFREHVVRCLLHRWLATHDPAVLT